MIILNENQWTIQPKEYWQNKLKKKKEMSSTLMLCRRKQFRRGNKHWDKASTKTIFNTKNKHRKIFILPSIKIYLNKKL